MRSRWLVGSWVLAFVACDEGSEGTPGSDATSAEGDAAGEVGDGSTDGGSASTSGPVEPADDTGENGSAGSETDGDDAGPGSTPVGCYDYDAFEPFAVGFRADVMPIFASSCASCHADPSASVYFGTGGTTEAEATAIYEVLLEGTPKQAPHLKFIVPGDPLRSYAMAKMEYDDPGGTCSEIQCSEPGCELQAPPTAQLPEADLAVVRSWILGGAAND